VRRPRVWLPEAESGALFELPQAEAHHLARVLRRDAGDDVEVLAAAGRRFRARIESIAEGPGTPRVILRVGEAEEAAPGLIPWTVAVAPVKGSGLDLAVRLASELGLEAIAPLDCERGQVRAAASRRPERWERIAREAAKQCGRGEPLRIERAVGLEEAFDLAPAGAGLWLAQSGAPFPEPAAFSAAGSILPALFLVGPEGGFSPREIEQARAGGARPLGFPLPVLRTSTAVMLIGALGALVRSAAGK
jgi:16S rRNA (uracil1498-N3)-methyltransferase